MNDSDKQNLLNDILKSSKGKIDPKAVSEAAKSGNASALVNSLSAQDKEKLNKLLSDKDALAEALKSPQAIALMKMFKGGGKNG